MKRKKLFVMALAVIFILSQSLVAMAASYNGTVGDQYFNASVYIKSDFAQASLAGSHSQMEMSTSATYIYVNPYTGVTGSETKSASGKVSASVSFSAPTGFRSLSINANFSVSYNGYSWSGNLKDEY